MKVKKYVVNDIREAIKSIKKELGPEAVIISSRKVRRKGVLGFLFPRMLEVTAAVDEVQENRSELGVAAGAESVRTAASPATRPVANTRMQAYQQALEHSRETKKESVARSKTEQQGEGTSNPVELEMRQEMEEMRTLLHRMSKKESYSVKEDDLLSRWFNLLTDLEIDKDIVDRLVSFISKELTHKNIDSADRIKIALISEVTRMLEPIYKDISSGKILTFIGPTGVGKTTTLAKLAAQFTLFHQKSIAILTIDTYRIGAVEQLRTYANIIGVPFEVVMTPQDLAGAVKNHSDKDLILIDTAGRPLNNKENIIELRNFMEVLPAVRETFLVLSATTRRRDLYKIIEDYSQVEFNKLIITKIDESDTLGAILNITYRIKTPVEYVTDGQNVPDDIEQVYAKKLAKLLLRGVDGQYEGPGF